MAAPVIKQIQGTLAGVLTIMIGCPIAGVAFTATNGELKGWGDIPTSLEHGALVGVGVAAGWIFFKSPFAPAFQTVIGSVKQTTEADGTVTKEARLEIGNSSSQSPGTTKTTSIGPVTIKEETKPDASQ